MFFWYHGVHAVFDRSTFPADLLRDERFDVVKTENQGVTEWSVPELGWSTSVAGPANGRIAFTVGGSPLNEIRSLTVNPLDDIFARYLSIDVVTDHNRNILGRVAALAVVLANSHPSDFSSPVLTRMKGILMLMLTQRVEAGAAVAALSSLPEMLVGAGWRISQVKGNHISGWHVLHAPDGLCAALSIDKTQRNIMMTVRGEGNICGWGPIPARPDDAMMEPVDAAERMLAYLDVIRSFDARGEMPPSADVVSKVFPARVVDEARFRMSVSA